MIWVYAGLFGLLVLAALPFYVFVLSKCAEVGRLSGTRTFVRHFRKDDGSGKR